METFSMNVIAQTLSAHSELIAPGVMGINFMRPEKPINTMSEVYKLVQEEEQNKVRSPTPGACTTPPLFRPSKIPPTAPAKPKVEQVVNAAPPPPAPAPAPKPVQTPVPQGPSQGPCSDCGRMIVGPFVSLSDRTLHEECFNCSTCGSSLKNVGFHNINNKLYCETHAKLAARVIASTAVPSAAPAPPQPAPPPFASAPVSNFTVAPVAPPKPVQAPVAPSKPSAALAPQAPVVPPSMFQSSIPQPTPTPFGQHLPQTPSSSGGLTFRSISPQPFKRLSGEYHHVNAPSSPTPGAVPSAPMAYSSGPLPFEMKPYMPPELPKSSVFSSISEASEITQSSQMSQTVQRTTQVTQQVTQQSHYSMDYKQSLGSILPKTKFVWPPPKSPFELENGPLAPAPPQNYSPLVTQSTPKMDPPAPMAPPPQQQPEASTCPFMVPPLPSTFAAQPVAVDEVQAQVEFSAPPPEPKLEPIPAPPPPEPVSTPFVPPLPTSSAMLGQGAQNFAPVLAPVADAKPTSAPQPGVAIGAGSKPAPKKGRGQLMSEQVPGRIPICGDCGEPIRGPFIIALNRTWCPDHFHCNNLHCKAGLLDIGFVEEQGQLYCENCYEAFLAPVCSKCGIRIKGDCLNALDKQWHPECFICAYCHKPFGNNSFYLEDGLPYCEKDWNELFTTKCISCGFPIEAGDRWVEALNNNYHSQCFKCSICQKNLEGQSFYAKGGKPYCKQHAR